MKKDDQYGVRALSVKAVPIEQLHPNPHNPRMLFDTEDLSILEASIRRVGILVPLTVYKESRSGKFFILDGQRRWICAQRVGLPKIPVNEVAEPTLVQNIVTMFQIHKLRKDWELMPTALKLDLLMNEIGDKNEKRIAAMTGLDEAAVVRCKKLLSYPVKYQDMMLDIDPKNRVKPDFFIELYAVRNDRVVNKFDWFSKNKFTDAMLKKFDANGMKSVTDFRVVKQHINNAVKVNKINSISKKLREFTEHPEYTIEHLNIESAKISAEAKKLSKSVDALYATINDINTDDYYGEGEMWDKLEALSKLIRDKLRTLGRRNV